MTQLLNFTAYRFARSGRPHDGDSNPGPGAYDADPTKVGFDAIFYSSPFYLDILSKLRC